MDSLTIVILLYHLFYSNTYFRACCLLTCNQYLCHQILENHV
uniref:Uncharacterized protein n=1 Tax=Arundo donax TaxID=35708 RepID=A0A0A8Z6B8_ARUDO